MGRKTANGLLGCCTTVSAADAKPGDLVFFHINAWTDHVGLVTEIENEQIKVVSGNVRLENGQNGVVELWYSLNDETIVAFGHPDWRVA